MDPKTIDWSSLGFGYVKTDMRYVSNFINGAWDEGGLTDQDMIMINTYSGCRQEITLRNGNTFLCDLPAMTTAVYNAQTGEQYL